MQSPVNTANSHILNPKLQFHPVDMASCSKFRKLKCLWHVSFTDLVLWACSCTVLDYSTHKVHLLRYYSRILSVLICTEGKF